MPTLHKHPNHSNGARPSTSSSPATWMSAGIGERAPILSGHLPTGERVQIVLPPAAEAPSVTIRRPSNVTFSPA